MLTKQDLKEALKDLATKKDLEAFVTKKEVQNQIDEAVAQIINAVSETLKTLATKDDVKRLEVRLDKVDTRLENVETDVRQIKRDIWDIKADLVTQKEFMAHEQRLKKLEEIHRKELVAYA